MKRLLLAALVTLVALGSLAQARTGAWVDEVVFFMEPTAAKAIEMVRVGAADVFTLGAAVPPLIRAIHDARLGYEIAYGLVFELTFNPYGPHFTDGRLNPFAVPRIREAMNWLVDREWIVAEIYGGIAGVPRFFPLNPVFPDYAKLADVARRIELYYAYDFERARAIITEEMEKLGATLVDGKWHYAGAPVVVIMIIRPEDERREIGDYVADQLEAIGFTTDRRYLTAAPASAIWLAGDPTAGLFHIATGGWIVTVVDRDQSDVWNFFYTPRGRPDPLWVAYRPDPVHDRVWEDLFMARFTTAEERLELMARALEYGMRDSVRVWIVNRVGHVARHPDLRVAADIAGGLQGAWLWPYTLRWADRVGGTVMMAQNNMLIEPWNPVAGTNWIFDLMPIRGTWDTATLPDPFTGFWWPQNVSRVDLTIQEGVLSLLTLEYGKDFGGGLRGWITQEFVPEIVVPPTAWADWDATTQTFITAEERFGGRTTARVRARVTYPRAVFDRVWHDGSKMTIADMLMDFIMGFDRAKPESAIHDPAAVPAHTTFMKTFRGFELISTSPEVVFEVYSDWVALEAETTASAFAWYLWPAYAQGPGPWHKIALGVQAEAARRLAFSSSRAIALGVEWMSYTAGPSLPILNSYLVENVATGFIPFAPTLGRFVTADEARARYANLTRWFADRGHLWVGSGPFYLDSVRPVERVLVLRRFPGFTDPATKWEVFAEPKFPEVAITGPATIRAGTAADITVNITFEDQPYPLAMLDFVTFMLFDGVGNIVATRAATAVRDGQFVIRLTADDTRGLIGACRVEVVAVSTVVAKPTFATFEFIVTR